MNQVLFRIKLMLILVLLLLLCARARADYTIRDAQTNAALTVFAFTCGSKICPATALIDQFGTPIGTVDNPIYITSSGAFYPYTLGQKTMALSVPVVLPSDQDLRTAAQPINVADISSTPNTGDNGVSYYTGTPTTGSAVAQAVNGRSTVSATITGTFDAVLQFEITSDGINWVSISARQRGGGNVTTAAGAGIFEFDLTAKSQFRIRAVTLNSGIASVAVSVSSAPTVVPNTGIEISKSAIPIGAMLDTTGQGTNARLDAIIAGQVTDCSGPGVQSTSPEGSKLVAAQKSAMCKATITNLGNTGFYVGIADSASPVGDGPVTNPAACRWISAFGVLTIDQGVTAIKTFTNGIYFYSTTAADCFTKTSGGASLFFEVMAKALQ